MTFNSSCSTKNLKLLGLAKENKKTQKIIKCTSDKYCLIFQKHFLESCQVSPVKVITFIRVIGINGRCRESSAV